MYVEPFFLAHPIAAEPLLLLRVVIAMLRHDFCHLMLEDFAALFVPEILVQERCGHERHCKPNQ